MLQVVLRFFHVHVLQKSILKLQGRITKTLKRLKKIAVFILQNLVITKTIPKENKRSKRKGLSFSLNIIIIACFHVENVTANY